MKNGRFTPEEREYLLSLDAVDEVRATSIVYSREFKRQCMDRYYDGESPGEIFASVGLPASLIGYKRIERAIYHWKEARSKDALTLTAATQVRHRNQDDTIKRKKRLAIERQRLMRDKERERYEARIAELEAQVQILKAEGVLAKKCGYAGSTLTKSQKFALIAHITRLNPRARVTTLCKTIGVSRSGYYKWKASAPARAQRDAEDLRTKELVEEAFLAHGFAKGSRQIRNTLLREKNVVMNRKKIQRIMRRFNIVFRKNEPTLTVTSAKTDTRKSHPTPWKETSTQARPARYC